MERCVLYSCLLSYQRINLKPILFFERGKYPNSIFVIFMCYLSQLKCSCLNIALLFLEHMQDRTDTCQENWGPCRHHGGLTLLFSLQETDLGTLIYGSVG